MFLFTSHFRQYNEVRFDNSPKIWFQFFVKTVAKLSEFTVEKGFKAIRNVQRKYAAFFDFIFGQTASWTLRLTYYCIIQIEGH